jgi:transposase-like protein
MARYRTHSTEFKRQVVQDYLAGETLHSLTRRHDLARNLIGIWIRSSKLAPSTTRPSRLIRSKATRRASPP